MEPLSEKVDAVDEVEVLVLERCLRNMMERMLPELFEVVVRIESRSLVSSAASSFLRLEELEPERLEKTLLTKDFLCLRCACGLNCARWNWSSGTGRRSTGMVWLAVLIVAVCGWGGVVLELELVVMQDGIL